MDSVTKFVVWAVAGFAAIASCSGNRQTSAGGRSDLKQAIANVKGTYRWRADLSRYDYSEKVRLQEILSPHAGEHAVTELIGCLDDTSPSSSTLDGKPVPLGTMCYEALSQLVYYEPTQSNGDFAAAWPGLVSPLTSPEGLREAKAAWKKASDAKLLIFQ